MLGNRVYMYISSVQNDYSEIFSYIIQWNLPTLYIVHIYIDYSKVNLIYKINLINGTWSRINECRKRSRLGNLLSFPGFLRSPCTSANVHQYTQLVSKPETQEASLPRGLLAQWFFRFLSTSCTLYSTQVTRIELMQVTDINRVYRERFSSADGE